MPAELTIPEKKKGRAGGKFGNRTNSVSETNAGIVNLKSRLDHFESNGQTLCSNRNLIFNG